MKLVNFMIIQSIVLYIVQPLRLSTQYLKADTLSENERLESDSSKYFAIMQSDGNFVVYSTGQTNGRGRDFPIWASNTNGKGRKPFRTVMQKDGNLVVYDATNSPKWASNTNGREKEPYNLIMQDDGNLVLYAKDNKPIWASNTMGKR
jgi:hypothetical protein